MKKTISLFVLALSALASFPAAAQIRNPQPVAEAQYQIDCSAVDVTKLTQDEIYTVRQACSSIPTVTEVDSLTPEAVREWANLGKEFSVAITETASGLGVAANEFLMTPLGMLIAIYFMWDFIGGILIGVPLLITLIWLYLHLRIHTSHYVTYKYEPTFFGLFNKKTISSIEPKRGDYGAEEFWSFAGFFTACLLVIAFLIF